MTEIEQTRARIEHDLGELEARLPGRIRSTKVALGAVVGSSTAAGIASWLLRQRRASQEAKARSTEVVVRIVTEPRTPEKD
ncbi:MAG: hypothetical protein ACRDHI_00500 [Actinomycetota bacterium]